MFKTTKTLAILSLLSGSLMVFHTDATQAQVVPFYAEGSDAIYTPDTQETSSFGKARHMGRIFGSGIASPSADLGNGLFEWTASEYQITAANGDQLFFTGGGTVQFIPIQGNTFFAVWSGEFTITGGTGRFSNAGPGDEPLAVVAINDPFQLQNDGTPIPGDTWTYSWTLDGTFDKGRNGK